MNRLSKTAYPEELVRFFSDLSKGEENRQRFLEGWKKDQGDLEELKDQTFAWVIGKSQLPWLEMKISPPYEAMLEEALNVQETLISHRSGDNPDPYLNNRGWKAVNLHGISSKHTQAFGVYGYEKEEDVPYRWTEIADACPETTRFFQKVYPCDMYYRVRFVVLEPGGYILPHVDRANSFLWEMNIALNHPSDCYFRMEPGLYVPFRPQSAFLLDVSHKHAVVNLSNERRFHMIVHGNPLHKEAWQELILKSFHAFLDELV